MPINGRIWRRFDMKRRERWSDRERRNRWINEIEAMRQEWRGGKELRRESGRERERLS